MSSPHSGLDLQSSVSRRAFLVRAGAVVGVTGFLAACGGGGGGTAEVKAENCAGYATLTDAERTMRQSLNYVDASVIPDQHCANCRFYNQPGDAAPCGGCQIFAGPVSPTGYCTSWARAAT